jgi:hypothetical protein
VSMRRVLGMLCVAAPFVAGAIAAASARRDLRLIAMALVATLSVWLLERRANDSVARVAGTFAVATLAAAATAIAFGARGVVGVGAVAIVLAGFATAGRRLLMK